MRLLRAEFAKLYTVRVTWVLTLIGLGLVAMTTALFTLVEDIVGPFYGTSDDVARAIDQIGGTSIIVLVVGLLMMSSEFRYGTAGRTLQITPQRSRVLTAKVAAAVVYAVAFYVASLPLVAAVLAFAGLRSGTAVVWWGPEVATALWHGPLGLALTAALGVAIGALLRSQVLAVTVTLLWLFVVENMVNVFLPHVARWLPFQALNAVFLSDDALAGAPAGVIQPLAPTLGLAVFVGYVVAALALAAVLMRLRDI